MNIGTYAVTNAIGYGQFYSRSHHAVIRVYDDAGNVIETHVSLNLESIKPVTFKSLHFVQLLTN
jgi:hypothetical protein